MANHNILGKEGEVFAQQYLLNKGYEIIHLNWRKGKNEIDIIAKIKDCLVFIEVKTRSGNKFGFPEDAVDLKKQNYLKKAANDFIEMHNEYYNIRFDIISVLLSYGKLKEIIHFEDAFF